MRGVHAVGGACGALVVTGGQAESRPAILPNNWSILVTLNVQGSEQRSLAVAVTAVRRRKRRHGNRWCTYPCGGYYISMNWLRYVPLVALLTLGCQRELASTSAPLSPATTAVSASAGIELSPPAQTSGSDDLNRGGLAAACIPSGTRCPDGHCCSSSQGAVCCGNGCCTGGSSCCSTHCCQAGYSCCGNGCCAPGYACCGNNQCCKG